MTHAEVLSSVGKFIKHLQNSYIGPQNAFSCSNFVKVNKIKIGKVFRGFQPMKKDEIRFFLFICNFTPWDIQFKTRFPINNYARNERSK